jgi:hypothetical protein
MIECLECGKTWETSAEDPDSTLSDALEHVEIKHPRDEPWLSLLEKEVMK